MSREKKLTSLEKAMARQMVKSWEAPQFTLFSEVNCKALIRYRNRLQVKMSYTTILAWVAAGILMEYPALNASWEDGTKRMEHERVNLGIAVDTRRGLLVPVIPDAGNQSLEEIHEAIERIKEKAKTGKFIMEDLSGGTVILSNLGMQNVTAFTAIVNAPNTAILSVGKMKDTPLAEDGLIVLGKTMTIGLNLDHRIADGGTGAKFLTELVNRLETIGEEETE